MNIFTSIIPVWISILFIISMMITIVLVANTFKSGAKNLGFEHKKQQQVFVSVVAFYCVYFLYVTILSINNAFNENTLPPKVLLFTTLPFIIFLVLFFKLNKRAKSIVDAIKIEALVLVHVFRLIGVFFFIAYGYNALPQRFAFIAGAGDIVTALLSIWVVKALINRKSYAKKLTIIWNVFGMMDIISVLITAILTTKLSIETGSMSLIEIGKFPFCLIPAFAPPTIIFLHVLIFKKIKEIK